MDPNETQKLLELYTEGVTAKALSDAAKYLESKYPGEKSSQKERLLTKILSAEQQIEDNRKSIENLTKEGEELNADLANCDLKSLEAMRAELHELQKKREIENEVISASHRSLDDVLRMKRVTEDLRKKLN